MSTLLYRQKNKSLLLSLILVIFVLISGLSALFYLNENQDLRQQAWLGNNDLGSNCVGGNCKTEDNNTGVFISAKENYKLDLTTNPDWRVATKEEQAKLFGNDPSLFIFRNEFGFATVFFDVLPFSESERGLTIDQLAEKFEQKFVKQSNYVGKQVVDLGKRTVARYEFTESFLGKTATYYEYLIPGKDSYLEAEVRFTSSLIVDQKLTEFLNSASFMAANEGSVKGATTENSGFAESEITELVKPSVANILHLYCKEIRLSSEIPANYLQRAYSFCNGSYGSGFLVDGSGLVATNGHVVTTYPEQDLIGGLNQGDPAIASFVVDFVREALATQGLATTPEQGLAFASQMVQNPSGVQVLVKSIYDLLETKAIEVVPVAEKYYVNLGNEPFTFMANKLDATTIKDFVKEKTAIFSADLVGANYANLFAKEIVLGSQKPMGSDVALLKLANADNYTYPSLHLGDANNLKEGDAILVIGFPGVVSGSDSGPALIDYDSSSTKATVTRGIVSSIKQDNQGNSLIQTDATIGHGNSGGPAFNDKGEVVGIATYGIMDEVGSFNFLRDIKDLKKLAEDQRTTINVNASETYQNWEAALGYYWQNRFTKSLEFLNKVEESYPVHPTAEGVVKEAQQAIEAGKDIDLIWGLNKTMVYTIGGLFSLVIVAGVVFFLIKKKRSAGVVLTQVANVNPSEPVITNPVEVSQTAPEQSVMAESSTQTEAKPSIDQTNAQIEETETNEKSQS